MWNKSSSVFPCVSNRYFFSVYVIPWKIMANHCSGETQIQGDFALDLSKYGMWFLWIEFSQIINNISIVISHYAQEQ